MENKLSTKMHTNMKAEKHKLENILNIPRNLSTKGALSISQDCFRSFNVLFSGETIFSRIIFMEIRRKLLVMAQKIIRFICSSEKRFEVSLGLVKLKKTFRPKSIASIHHEKLIFVSENPIINSHRQLH